MIPALSSYAMPQEKEFPKNRVQWEIKLARTVLLVHDLQEYFVQFFDTEQAPIPELLQHTAQLIQQCRQANIPVVYTAQPGDQDPKSRALLTDFWGPGLKADDQLTRIVPAIEPQTSDTVLTKWRYSAFKRTPLQKLMQDWQRDQLLICGVYAHIGCLMTAAEAFMLDIQPFLIGDALADFSREEHLQALEYTAKRCGQVASTQTVLHILNTTSQGEKAHA